MGLDMSLYREVSLKGKMEITDKNMGAVLNEDTMRPIAKHEVCYWRKFNALHKYFDDNFNDSDNDNCVDMYMNIEDIEELLKLVKKIRGAVKMGKGFVSSYEGSVDKKKLKGCKIGDEVVDKVEHEDNITSVIITRDFGNDFWLDYRQDGEVVVNPKVCEDLPTEEGFFFGSTDYDEYYIYQLDETIKQLSKVVSEHKTLIKSGVREGDINYYYRAWY